MATVVDFPPSETLRPEQAVGEVAKTRWHEFNDQIARYNFAQQLPYNKLAQYMGLIQGDYGGSYTTTEQRERGVGDSILQGAQAGLGIAGALIPGGGLLTAGLGAGLGAILGSI